MMAVGFSMIIDTSGKIISCDSGLSYRKIGINDNVYEFYAKSGEVAEKTYDSQQRANIQEPKSLVFLCLRKRTPVSYLAYEPLDMNDWMLCYVVPQSKAQEEVISLFRKQGK